MSKYYLLMIFLYPVVLGFSITAESPLLLTIVLLLGAFMLLRLFLYLWAGVAANCVLILPKEPSSADAVSENKSCSKN